MFAFIANSIAIILTQRQQPQTKETGQGLVEYALILVLIAIVVIVAVTVFGTTVSNQYCNLIRAFPGQSAAKCS